MKKIILLVLLIMCCTANVYALSVEHVNGEMKVTWDSNDSPYEGEYECEWSTNSDFSDSQTIKTETREVSIPIVSKKHKYYLRIKSGKDLISFIGEYPTFKVVLPNKTLKCYKGEKVTLPSATKSHYKFTGWSTKKKIYLTDYRIGKPKYSSGEKIGGTPGKVLKLYACFKPSDEETVVDWAKYIVDSKEFKYPTKVKSHCYFCSGGKKEFICNSFCVAAYTHGYPHFKKYWCGSTKPSEWTKRGFKKISNSKKKRGDIICFYRKGKYRHIAIVYNKKAVIHASEIFGIKVTSLKNVMKKYSSYCVLRKK